MAAASTYRLPKPDGSFLEGVTVQDGMVIGPSGKQLGPVRMFPDLQDGNGARVADTSTSSSSPTVLTAPATNSEGVTREDGIEGTKADLETELRNDERTNVYGIKQNGMTLGGIKQFNEQYGLNIADASTLFDMTVPGRKDAYKGTGNKIETDETGYEIPKGAKPVSGSTGGIEADTEVLTGKAGGYTIPPASVPGTTGHTPEDPQNGVSSAADTADQTRALSVNSGRGSRKDPRNRNNGGNTPFGGVEPSNESLVSPMYKDKARNAYRSGFLDSTAKGPMGVLRDAAAAQGVIRTNDGKIAIKKGDEYLTYTGDKSAREVAYDLGGGQSGWDKHRDHFTSLGVPDKPEIKPDDEQTPGSIQPAPQQSGIKPGTIKPQENTGGAFESPAPITKPAPGKYQEAQSFAQNFRDRLRNK